MATYDFKCPKCHSIVADVILPMTHVPDDRPHCCDEPMQTYITTAPMVHWVHPVFDAVPMPAIPGKPVVSTHKQRDELMARHDLVDANDLPPPSYQESQDERKKMHESINAISLPDEAKDSVQDIV